MVTAWKASVFGVFLVRIFPHRTEYGEILRISPYSVRMRENADQKNSEYRCFSRSVSYFHFHSLYYFFLLKQADHITSNFLKTVSHKFYLVHSWILCLGLNMNPYVSYLNWNRHKDQNSGWLYINIVLIPL